MATSSAIQNPPSFAHAELATFLNGLADTARTGAQQRLRSGAQHFQQLATAPVVYATPDQREELERLCRHPLLPRPTKTQVLVNILRFTKVQAAEAITKLQSTCAALDDMRDAV